MAVRKPTSSSGRAARATASKPKKGAAGSKSAVMPDRQQRIEERAYYKAEQRGFMPGMELQDWLEAELEEGRKVEKSKNIKKINNIEELEEA
jgi:hypothetical protein